METTTALPAPAPAPAQILTAHTAPKLPSSPAHAAQAAPLFVGSRGCPAEFFV